MADDNIKAHIKQQLTIAIEVVVENERHYTFSMPYGSSFGESHAVSLEVSKAIVQMAETAKKQEEERKDNKKEEDAKE